MTERPTHLVLVPGLACAEDPSVEQIASLAHKSWSDATVAAA